ncbi:MAG: DNA polymerase I, partial [Desulfitobacteriaceae bacterium]|nr:DNA polymerase I [Desulfitobacteriaceae bacterium]
RRAALIWELAPVIQGRIADQEMDDLYRQVELPLEDVLAGMEITGVKVDSSQLKVMSGEMEGAIENLSREIYQLAGEEFNINSPKQLGVILFDKLGLPPIKKTKTGYSTNAEVLERLAEQHEIAAKIVEHRTLVKLKSTYVDGMQSLINPETGNIHTSFNQTVTATGRLSSTEPNLQNIPIRMELGRLIRKAFGPSQNGNILLAGDYSQIELRVLAHISGDPVLQEAFREDQDIHARTAAEVFGVPMEEVVPEMRRRAKAVNFGIVYGISDYGLSRDLGITRKEAKKYINNYFARYQGVAEYLHRVIKEARDKGYVTTLLNRRRYLPDIYSPNFNIRSFGERTAMNTPIQGSAADIIKIAMVNIHQAFQEAGFRSKMILQVHDELIFDVVPEEIEIVSKIVKELMENAIILSVPLKVDLKSGIDWYSMKRM